MMRFSCLFLIAAVTALSVGCGKDPNTPPPLAKVKGTVTIDGKPMPGGEVRFTAAAYPPRSIEVKDGAFSGEVFTGKNHVDVVWEKDGPPHPMDPKVKLKVNAVSDKFSGANSPFKPEIAAGGASDLKFDVTSRK